MSEKRLDRVSQDPSPPPPSASVPADLPRLGFTLRTDAQGTTLVIADKELFGWLRVQALELAVPGANGQAAASPPAPEAFQRHRTYVQLASLRIDQRAFDRYLAMSAPRLARMGVEELALRCTDEYLSVVGRVREGKSVADLSARLYLLGTRAGIRILIGQPRVYGYLPTPAPIAAHRLLAALLRATPADGHTPTAAARLSGGEEPFATGMGQFELAPLSAFLWYSLPPAGWRLPSTSAVELQSVRVTRKGVELVYGNVPDTKIDAKINAKISAGGRAPGPGEVMGSAEARGLAEAYAQLEQGDRALLGDDIDGALRAYRGELAAGGPDQPEVVERILSVSAAHPSSFMEVGELAKSALTRWPGYAAAHSSMANVAAAQGDARSAALHFQRLAELAEDEDTAVRAALAGARLMRTIEPETATRLYELAREHVPEQGQSHNQSQNQSEIAGALLERYAAEGRWAELVTLHRARLSGEGDRAARSREHLRMAEILRDRLADADAARAEIELACQLDLTNVSAFEALAGQAVLEGRFQDAMDTLDHVAKLWSERGDVAAQVRTYLHAAELCERVGNHTMAEDFYHSALELDEHSTQALVGAASAAARRDDHRRAIKLWNRLIARTDNAPRELGRYRLELGRNLVAAGNGAAAREVLVQTASLGIGDLAAEAHSLLALLHRQEGELPAAAAELEAAVQALTRAAESIFAQATADLGDSGDDEGEAAGRSHYAEGKRYLHRASQLALERAELLGEMGQEEAARGDYFRAHSLARDVDPARAREAARCLLRAEERRGDRRAQRRWIDALLATQPAAEERATLLLGRAELRARDPRDTEGALRDVQEVLGQEYEPGQEPGQMIEDETRATALGLQARLLAALGERDGQARALAGRATLMATPLARALAEAEAAEAWLEAEDADAALIAARRARDQLAAALASGVDVDNPVRARVLALLGETAWRRRAWNDVIEGYQPLIDAASTTAIGIEQIRYAYRLGTALDGTGDRTAAALAFERVLASDDSPPDVRTSTWRTLAQVHERAGNLIEAAETYEALAADRRAKAGLDSRAEALYRASELYRKQHNRETDAERCLEAALALVNDHMPALDGLEQLKRRQGDYERVGAIISRKIAVSAHHPQRQKALLIRLAELQAEHLGRLDVARITYHRVLELDPNFRPALRFVAPDELMSGNLQQAADAYERLSRDLPGDGQTGEVGQTGQRGQAVGTGELMSERISAAGALAEVALKGPRGSDLRASLVARSRIALTALLEVAPGHPSLLAHLGALDAAEQPQAAASPAPLGPGSSPAGNAVAELRERADQAAEKGDYSTYASILGELIAAMAAARNAAKLRQRTRRAELYLELAGVLADHLGDRLGARQAMTSAADTFGPGSRRDATLRILAAEAAADGADDEAVAAYERIEPTRRSAADCANLATAYRCQGQDWRAMAVLEQARADAQLTDEAARLLFLLRQEMSSKAEHARALEDCARSARPGSARAERARHALEEALELYDEALGDQVAAERVRAALSALEHAALQPARQAPEVSAGVTADATPDTAPRATKDAAVGATSRAAAAKAVPRTNPGAMPGAMTGPGSPAAMLRKRPATITAPGITTIGFGGDKRMATTTTPGIGTRPRVPGKPGIPPAPPGKPGAAITAPGVGAPAPLPGKPMPPGHPASTAQPDDDAAKSASSRTVQAFRDSRNSEIRVFEHNARSAAAAGNLARAADSLADAIILRSQRLAEAGGGLDDATRAALDELRRVVTQSGRLDALAKGLLAVADAETNVRTASGMWLEAGRILREKLGDSRQSADAFIRALEATPDDAGLFIEADAALRRVGDIHQLVHAYELHLATLSGQSRARPLYELGRIFRDVFNDGHRAGDYFERAHDADPEMADVWLPLANQLVAQDDVIGARELYERALERGSHDPETRSWLVNRIDALSHDPAVVAGELGHLASPAAHGERVAARPSTAPSVPAEPPAWPAQPAVDPAAAATLEDRLRQGSELERRGQLDAAATHYSAAAGALPSDPRPLAALERIYRKRGETEALIEVLGRQLELVPEGRERAVLWFRRAKLYRDVLHREAETYDSLRHAHAADADDSEIAYALRTIAMARGEWPLVAELMQREIAAAADDREAGALFLELALIYDEKLLDAEKARIHYEKALALDPEIPAAPRPLARLYEIAGRQIDAARMYEQAARHIKDESERSQLLQRAAASAELAGDNAAARRLYQLAVVTATTDRDARSSAQAALKRLATAGERSDLLEIQLQKTSSDRLELLHQLLERATLADDSAAAERHARSLIALDAADSSAYLVLKARAEATGNWTALATLLEARAATLTAPAARAAAYHDLGRLQQNQLGDPAAAMGAYERALASEPIHPAALDALAEMVFEHRDWKRAKELYARIQADRSSLSAVTIAQRRGAIEEALGNDAEALAAYSQALGSEPPDATTLTAVVRIALRVGDLARAIDGSRALLELMPTGDDNLQPLTMARLQLAELCRRAGDVEQAIHYNELALSESPRSQPALRALSRLYVQKDDLPGAVRALRTLIGLTSALPQRAELQFRLGELYRTRVADPERAADAYLKAIDLDPTHVPTLRRLVDYYWRQDDPDELLVMVTGLVEQAALLHEGTDGDTLARAMLAAATRNDTDLTRQIASWLGDKAINRLCRVLVEAAGLQRRQLTDQVLAAAAAAVCAELPTVSIAQVGSALAASARPDLPDLPALLAAVRARA